ncbi:hypothetical protein [Arthrobacter sp.]|uniref:hypothetical protein n=1 Tax=Arthrobacter sp. TaxID=1667 RepID=UPI003391055B
MSTPGKRPGPAQDRWYAADAGRLLGALLVPASWLVAGWPAAAAMLLVCGGQWLLRWYLLGRPADAVGQLVLLAAGWFSAVGLYHQVSWLDAVMHALASLVVALLVAELLGPMLLRAELLVPRGLRAVVLVGATVTLGVVWELGEWLGHTYITPEIGVGYEDTIGDLAANFIGAVLGAAVRSRHTRQGDAYRSSGNGRRRYSAMASGHGSRR